jgi:hypothetical protein
MCRAGLELNICFFFFPFPGSLERLECLKKAGWWRCVICMKRDKKMYCLEKKVIFFASELALVPHLFAIHISIHGSKPESFQRPASYPASWQCKCPDITVWRVVVLGHLLLPGTLVFHHRQCNSHLLSFCLSSWSVPYRDSSSHSHWLYGSKSNSPYIVVPFHLAVTIYLTSK